MHFVAQNVLANLMFARYYSAGLSRFLSVDPGDDNELEDPQSWNRYAYSGNNPILYRDPDGRVKFNSVADQQAYNQAKSYLSSQTGGKAAFRLLESLKGSQEPTLATNSRGRNAFASSTNTIHWDPSSGLDVSGEGGSPGIGGSNVMNSDLILFHEMNHAIQSNLNPGQFMTDANTFDAQYDNAEERRVIEKGETNLARGLGQATRATHGGRLVKGGSTGGKKSGTKFHQPQQGSGPGQIKFKPSGGCMAGC